MDTAVVSKKGWVVIPKAIRDKLGIRPGTRVRIDAEDGIVMVVPLSDDPIEAAYGMFASDDGPSMLQEVIEEHRRELEREEREIERHTRSGHVGAASVPAEAGGRRPG